MARHVYFEELCALAPLGELSPSQLRELDQHIAGCDECRQGTLDYQRLFQQVVPAVTRSDEEFIESRRNDVRAAVLRNVAAIDSERHRELGSARKERHLFASVPFGFSSAGFSFAMWSGLGVVSLVVAAFWIGAHFYGGGHGPRQVSAGGSSIEPPVSAQPALTPKVAPVRPSTEGDTEDRQLIAALDQERQQNTELARKLSVEDGQLAQAIAAQDALRAQIAQQTQALALTKSDLDAKTVALTQARSANSSDGATIAGLELQVHDLAEKMNTQTASLDRERDLLSHGREIRDIIGARNLHIIDVYDTDTGGETKKAFARAFYTEGKSLVFYAYDLPQRRADNAKYEFVAWGEKNGNQHTVQKIGLLFHDDQAQRRWSLNFTDPKVLSEIDSVFITLEQNNENLSQPKGKRMLTAYLGTAPNHP